MTPVEPWEQYPLESTLPVDEDIVVAWIHRSNCTHSPKTGPAARTGPRTTSDVLLFTPVGCIRQNKALTVNRHQSSHSTAVSQALDRNADL